MTSPLHHVPRLAIERSTTISAKDIRPLDPDKLVEIVVTSLDDDKAEEILVIDLRVRSSIGDHLVIATGRSQRQVGAMADHLLEKMKQQGLGVSLEGMQQGDWVLIDAGDIVVHLFRPEVRGFYNLEGMWGLPAPEKAGEKVAGGEAAGALSA
jgi:ribosome-associated protein